MMWIQLASDAYNSCMVSVVWNQKWIHGLGMCLFFVRTSNDKLNLSDKSATINCCGSDKFTSCFLLI